MRVPSIQATMFVYDKDARDVTGAIYSSALEFTAKTQVGARGAITLMDDPKR